MIQQSPTKQSMASSMLITRPRSSSSSSSSSSDGSTMSVPAAGSKKEDDALLARVLVRSRARPPPAAHGLPSEYRRPLKKARFNCTGVSEKLVIFLQDKEDHDDKDGIQGVAHRGSLSSSISSTFLSGTSSDSTTGNEEFSSSSSFSEALTRLHECMIRTAESNQRLVQADILSTKKMVASSATASPRAGVFFLTGGGGGGRGGINRLHCPLEEEEEPAGRQDDCCSSSCASSVGSQLSSSSDWSSKGTHHLGQGTVPEMKKPAALRDTTTLTKKKNKWASMSSRTGVAFRPCMAELFLLA